MHQEEQKCFGIHFLMLDFAPGPCPAPILMPTSPLCTSPYTRPHEQPKVEPHNPVPTTQPLNPKPENRKPKPDRRCRSPGSAFPEPLSGSPPCRPSCPRPCPRLSAAAPAPRPTASGLSRSTRLPTWRSVRSRRAPLKPAGNPYRTCLSNRPVPRV